MRRPHSEFTVVLGSVMPLLAGSGFTMATFKLFLGVETLLFVSKSWLLRALGTWKMYISTCGVTIWVCLAFDGGVRVRKGSVSCSFSVFGLALARLVHAFDFLVDTAAFLLFHVVSGFMVT